MNGAGWWALTKFKVLKGMPTPDGLGINAAVGNGCRKRLLLFHIYQFERVGVHKHYYKTDERARTRLRLPTAIKNSNLEKQNSKILK